MDNKEAIKELSEWLDGCCGGKEIEPTRQALRLAISALQAQEVKTQLSAEGTTSDLISRQAAIEAVSNWLYDTQTTETSDEVLLKLPSAQPENEERKEESAQNVPKEDLISRKAAIDAECEVCQIAPKKERGHNCIYYVHGCKEIECLRVLPSSQPEPQWIPVSEKLPGENEFVLVTFGWFGRKTDPGVNIDEIRDGDWMISEVVTAWMPLPEPYRAERRTDEGD